MKYLIYIGLWVIGSLAGNALYYNLQDGEMFGATIARTTITNPWTFASTTKQGSTGTEIARTNTGTCHLNFGVTPASITATTSKQVDCQGTNMLASASAVQSALAGVSANDKVFLEMSTTTPTTFLGLDFQGCSASTTAGYITCNLKNQTGAAFTPATTTTYNLQYWVTK